MGNEYEYKCAWCLADIRSPRHDAEICEAQRSSVKEKERIRLEAAAVWVKNNINELRTDAVTVWKFYSAPQPLQDLSNHGGDEDHLAFVPHALKDEWFSWLEEPHFGCFEVSIHVLPFDWGIIHIGAHS